MESKPIEFKVTFLGDSSVGKTCIFRRYLYDEFNDTQSTIGVDQIKKEVEDYTPKVTLAISDTAGQESFGGLTKLYTRNSNAFLIVYSIDEQSSFDSIEKWINIITETCVVNNCLVYLVENKIDLRTNENNNKILIPEGVGENKAEELGYEFVGVSAKSGENIIPLFKKVAFDCLERFYNSEIITPIKPEYPDGKDIVLNDKQDKCKC